MPQSETQNQSTNLTTPGPLTRRRVVHFGLHEKSSHCESFLIRDLAQNPRSLRYEALVYTDSAAVVTCVGCNRSLPILAIQFGPSGTCIDYAITKPDKSVEIVPKRSAVEIFEYAVGLIGQLWFEGHYNEGEDLWLAFTVKPK